MKRKEFGPIVAELRKGQFDLSSGKVWSQQTLADKIGVSDRLIAALEQGTKSHLDAEILGKLAKAFQLTTLERREFFALAAGVANDDLMLHAPPPVALLAPLLAALAQLHQPAYLHDGLFDIVALNSHLLTFFATPDADTFQRKVTVRLNCLEGIFADESSARTTMNHHWRTMALRAVHLFRALSLRYRHTTYYKTLFRHLCALPNFSTIWAQTQQEDYDIYSHVQCDAHHHPDFGPVQYLVTRTTTITSYGNLYLTTFAPANPTTVAAFATMTQHQPATVREIAPWPNPYLL